MFLECLTEIILKKILEYEFNVEVVVLRILSTAIVMALSGLRKKCFILRIT